MDSGREKQRVFVGLGNPGKKYEMTRHNMGAIVVQSFSHVHGLSFKEEKKLLSFAAKGTIRETSVHLVLPTTYMNESGLAVRKVLDYYKLGPEDLVIVSDDSDIPFGEMRLRSKGSSGGHNGLKSVQQHLGTDVYVRLRIGIGRGEEKSGDLSDHVLDKFSRMEADRLPEIVQAGIKALTQLLEEPVENVMNVVNIRPKQE